MTNFLFIKKFDEEHPLSASQEKEIKIYKRINALRDGTELPPESKKIWENF